eukprot:274141_1
MSKPSWKSKLLFGNKNRISEPTRQLLDVIICGDTQSVLAILRLYHKKISLLSQDDLGNSPIHLATIHHRVEIMRIMLELAPNIASIHSRDGKTAMCMAVELCHSDIIDLLIRYHANVDLMSNDKTPLMTACIRSCIICVKVLLEAGANPHIADSKGRTAVDFTKMDSIRVLFAHSPVELSRDVRIVKSMIQSTQTEQIIDRSYKLMKKIGEGTFGSTYIARNTTHGFRCVVKTLAANTLDDINSSIAEALTLALFKDVPNIVEFKDFFLSRPGNIKEENFSRVIQLLLTEPKIKPGSKEGICFVNLAMEYAEGGDLFSLVSKRLGEAVTKEEEIEKNKECMRNDENEEESEDYVSVEPEWISEGEILRIIEQICLALSEIHRCNFIHRDIKPGNIFLDKENNVKIGDFGIAKLFDKSNDGNVPAHTIVGSQNYMASEIYNTSQPYDQSVDMFAVGCVIYFLVKFNHPNFFMKDARKEVLTEVKDWCSEFLYKMMTNLWNPNPQARPTAEDVVLWIRSRNISDISGNFTSLSDNRNKLACSQETRFHPKKQRKLPIRKAFKLCGLISREKQLYQVRHTTSGENFMMKRVACSSLNKLNLCLKEAAYLSYMKNCNQIISYHDTFIDQTFKRELNVSDEYKIDDEQENHIIADDHLSVCIVMENTERSVYDIIEKFKDRALFIPEELILHWTIQCSQALAYIHERGLIHRNIKTSNMFVDDENNLYLGEFTEVKDTKTFGCAKTLVGSFASKAPEMGREGIYSFSVDIFSLGFALHDMLILDRSKTYIDYIVPARYSDFIQRLLEDMLARNPEARPPAEAICRLISKELLSRQLTKSMETNSNKSSLNSYIVTKNEAQTLGKFKCVSSVPKIIRPEMDCIFQALSAMQIQQKDQSSIKPANSVFVSINKRTVTSPNPRYASTSQIPQDICNVCTCQIFLQHLFRPTGTCANCFHSHNTNKNI